MTDYVMPKVPVNLVVRLQFNVPLPLLTTVPLAPCEKALMLAPVSVLSTSLSLASTLPVVIAVSSLPAAASLPATGASLTAAMLIVAVSLDCRDPPPAVPLSLTFRVNVALALGASVLSMYLTGLVALLLSSALICATVPVIVTEEVPLLLTTAPLVPVVTLSVPSVTDRITDTELEPASTSLIESPVFFRLRLVCSVAL